MSITDIIFLERSDFPECLVLKFDIDTDHIVCPRFSGHSTNLSSTRYVKKFMQKSKDHPDLTEEQIQECCHNLPINGSCIIRVMNSNLSIFLSIDNYNAPILNKDSLALRNLFEEGEAGLFVGGILPEGLAQTCCHAPGHFGLGRYDGSWNCTGRKFAQKMFGLMKAQVRTLDSSQSEWVPPRAGYPEGPEISENSTTAVCLSLLVVLSGSLRQPCFRWM
ncbi:hypothetical protein IW262DRAFT_952257 [Armillaria fumosa]|nr:hypothetical protein IW262DRAFT_952257 [Armillaria fumosa]